MLIVLRTIQLFISSNRLSGLSELTTILAVAVSVIILCIVIAIVFIIRIRIKKKRENNQPPVQWNSPGRHSPNQYGFNDPNYDPVTIPPVVRTLIFFFFVNA